MDLGISGKKALICGASSGLGLACATALAEEGVSLVLVAREPIRLNQVAQDLQQRYGVTAQSVSADITTSAGREQVYTTHPEFDILLTNAAGPPPGDFRDWDRSDWIRAIDANMLTPIELIRHYVDGMMRRGFGRIVNLTSSAVKSPVTGLGLSTGARMGLTGFVAGLARTTVAHGVTINNLLPGTFDTPRLASNFENQARREGLEVSQVIERRLAKHPAHRFGQPQELGKTFAFLCSVHAGYINGQNLLLDAGSFATTG
jgi:3-oxoacyl-[acyl-carrier protein] reductase